MNLQTIIDIDTSIRRLDARLGCMLEPDMREALSRATFVMAEIRHFAVCWVDAEKANAQTVGAVIEVPVEMLTQTASMSTRDVRQACIDRLVQTLRPETV